MVKFDLIKELESLKLSNMLKKGFEVYIENNNIKINNKKEFNEELEKYKNYNVGG